MQKTVVITDEEIQKALETLGLSVQTEGNDIEKSEKSEPSEESKKEEEKKDEYEDVEKAYNDAKKSYDEVEKSYNMKKAELDTLESKLNKKKAKKDPEIKKSEDNSLQKTQENEILKSITDTLSATKIILSDLRKQNDLLKSENSDIKKSLSEVTSQLTDIGNQSQGRKSFTKATAIEKSFGGESLSNKKQISISQNKQELNNLLFDLSGIEKGEKNDLYANAVMTFEASGVILPSVTTDLFNKHNIQLVS